MIAGLGDPSQFVSGLSLLSRSLCDNVAFPHKYFHGRHASSQSLPGLFISLKHLEVFHTFSKFLHGIVSILSIARLSPRLSRPRKGKQNSEDVASTYISMSIDHEFRQCEPRKRRKSHGSTAERLTVCYLADQTSRSAIVTVEKLTNLKV
jgi:hypothetical protein